MANPEPLQLLIELNDASAVDLAEFYHEVSKLYRMMGGDGIDFKVRETRVMKRQWNLTESDIEAAIAAYIRGQESLERDVQIGVHLSMDKEDRTGTPVFYAQAFEREPDGNSG